MKNDKFIDYYFILQVDKNASFDEIRESYLNIMTEYNDNVFSKIRLAKDTAKELKIWASLASEAYRTLSNGVKRAKYDLEYEEYLKENPEEKTIKNSKTNNRRQNSTQKRGTHESPKTTKTAATYQGAHLKQAPTPSPVNSSEASLPDLTQNAKDLAAIAASHLATAASNVKTFSKNLASDYHEVREEEKANRYIDRFDMIDDKLYENHQGTSFPLKEELTFELYRGKVHAYTETMYQLSKLKYRRNEGFQHYILRNRKLLGIITAGAFLAGGLALSSEKEEGETVYVPSPTAIITPQETPQTIYTLNCIHTIKKDETLSAYETNSNTSMDEIRKLNNIEGSKILEGNTILIPYKIKEEDLDLYTKPVKCTVGYLGELYAKSFETDLATLQLLNPGVVETTRGLDGTSLVYTTNNEIILVPNFLTKQEYTAQKNDSIGSQK